MNTYLAVDIGASGGRHIVGWLDGGRLQTQEVYRFENGAQRVGGRLAWDIEGLYSSVLEGMRACRQAGFIPSSMGIDTWGVDFVLLDRAGERLGDAVAYRDRRTEGMDSALDQALSPEALYAITGIARQPFNTLYQMMAVCRKEPQAAQQADDFLLIPEYLSYRLTGRKLHEYTNLTTGALIDAQSRTWAWPVIDAAGLPRAWFRTPIVMPGAALGNLLAPVAAEVGFDTRVVFPATHDTGSAFMAVPVRDDGAAFLSSGTWSLLGTELSSPITKAQSLREGFTNEGGYGASIRYLKNIMGMWMLQCLRAETGKRFSYDDMARMAAGSPYNAWVDAADGRYLAPKSMLREVQNALEEQGAPAPKDFADVCRAVTMGLAVCYRDSLTHMARLTGKRFTSLHIVGGGCQNDTLNRMTASAAGLPVWAGPVEGTALGNLMAQMIALGDLADLPAARAAVAASFPIRRFDPNGSL